MKKNGKIAGKPDGRQV